MALTLQQQSSTKSKYSYVTVDMPTWRTLVLAQYPTATFRRYSEGEGGGCDSWANGEFVGDWDGGGNEPAGRIANQ